MTQKPVTRKPATRVPAARVPAARVPAAGSPGPGAATFRWLNRVGKRRWVQHVNTALGRFNERLGTQFAAALTYFSFLAMIPILMVAFSIAGFVLSAHPALLSGLQNDIATQLPSGLSSTVRQVLATAVGARLGVGIIGLVIALYSGMSWMGNLRAAIQAMWRPEFDKDQETYEENLLVYYAKSLEYLLFLGVAIAVSLALTAGGSSAQQLILRWLGLDRVAWLTPVFTVGLIAVAVAADTLIFLWVYYVLAPHNFKPDRGPLIRGAIMTAVAFEVLKVALTFLLPLLLSSATAKLFGPFIGLLFFFNLAATVVMFVAAWIATGAPLDAAAAPLDAAAAPLDAAAAPPPAKT